MFEDALRLDPVDILNLAAGSCIYREWAAFWILTSAAIRLGGNDVLLAGNDSTVAEWWAEEERKNHVGL
jgi:hypothetical protein